MDEDVLSRKQKDLLPFIASFSDNFGLIGGTSIALQLGHRRSIDFDLVTLSQLDSARVRGNIGNKYRIDAVLVDQTNEYTLVINGVKITFMHYPFKFDLDVSYEGIVKIPDLSTLSSIKAYALGRRAKWKDPCSWTALLVYHYIQSRVITQPSARGSLPPHKLPL
jgi:hypothetical protein